MHYAAHFGVVFETMDMPHNVYQWDDFFPCNTCDFWNAESAGLDIALRKHYNLSLDYNINLEKYYRCCSVHFNRTLTRVLRNGALVPPKQRTVFYNSACELLTLEDPLLYLAKIWCLISEFPKLKRWIH